MQLAIRISGGVALALLLLGAVYFFGTSAFMCFDVCPSLDAFPGVALRQVGVSFGAGLLLALVAWVLFLLALARSGARRGMVIAVVVPVILAAALILALAFVPPAALLPTTEAEYGGWTRKILLASLVTIGLVVVMVVLAPSPPRREG